MSAGTALPVRHVIDGQTVELPVRVRSARSATATFLVPAPAARAWLPDPALQLVTPIPGRAVLSIAAVDYIDNDLGDYNELAIGLFVRPASVSNGSAVRDLLRGRPAIHVRWMPVDQPFTREAGERIWGFPKTVDEIPLTVEDGLLEASWIKDGQTVLDLRMPARGGKSLPPADTQSFTMMNGRLHRVPFRMAPTDARVSSGRRVRVRLGDHPLAEELRALGMPRRALMAMWMGNLEATFMPAEPA
ncbi:MAG: acetoacetate decarboxylase family protein [Nitriliruptorales bacterium]|nr:acetoacetate decarboxylase family protein [Nitriliruptorales bacterium]